MLTTAQQKFLELRKNGIRAAVFEGAWSPAGAVVFELGQKAEAKSSANICGFVTYEGQEHFYEITREHSFSAEPMESSPLVKSESVLNSSVSPDEYIKKITQIKELILEGETYQVNYSIPFVVSAASRDPFEIYCALARMNPSPYMCFIETEDGALISNSPECLMQLTPDGTLITKPIKGTLPRGVSNQQDAEIEARLLASEKNKAELSMIIDLERNDLGRVCVPGSVRAAPRHVEKYSHVIHTVSKVEGKLEHGKTWRDALDALFPGGSVTGCPKIRTMEIIKKLEDGPRGIYCGSAGFVLAPSAPTEHPNVVLNILIRSLWFNRAEQTITFRSGGGIVADSTPQDEYTELLHKAAAIAGALSL